MSQIFYLGPILKNVSEKRETFAIFLKHFFLNFLKQKLGPIKKIRDTVSLHWDLIYISMKCH